MVAVRFSFRRKKKPEPAPSPAPPSAPPPEPAGPLVSPVPLPGDDRTVKVNLSRLLQFADTPEHYQRVTRSFIENLTRYLEELRHHAARQDAARVAETAHAAAGACGAIGADGMEATLRLLEKSAESGRLTGHARLLGEVEAEFARVRELLRTHQTAPAPGAAAPDAAAGRMKVLIIEDDLFVAGLYRARLEEAGYEVEFAQDGQAGFYRIHEWHPQLVLLDLMLPKMSGLDILRKIRVEQQFHELPVLVFTNTLAPTLLNGAIEAGATHIFNKASTGPEQLLGAIERALCPLLLSTAPAGQTPAPPDGVPADSVVKPAALPPAEVAPADAPAANTTRRQPKFVLPGSMSPLTAARAIRSLEDPPPPPAETHPTETQLRRKLVEHADTIVTNLRRDYLAFSRGGDETAQAELLGPLYRAVHSLTSQAGISGLHAVSEATAALELLIHDLREHPRNLAAPTRRTVAQAIDFLARLLARAEAVPSLAAQPAVALVVDDDEMSREAVVFALKQTRIQPVPVAQPAAARQLAGRRRFDLFVLDVGLPGTDGFELCEQLRATPGHETTPVVFVTGRTDLESRTRSRNLGVNDYVTKPFLVVELIVKAIIHLLSARLPE